MGIQENEKRIDNQIRKMKLRWQLFFVAGLLPYVISLLYFFNVHPGLRLKFLPYFSNLDSLSFILAILLAVGILIMKRKYLSRKFVGSLLKNDLPEKKEDSALIKEVFSVLNQKFTLIWLLGILLIIEGVIFYWLTFSDRNMHLYAFVGAYSLLMNYPRKIFFSSISYQVNEVRPDDKKEAEI